MKRLLSSSLLITIVSTTAMLAFSGCGKKSNPTPVSTETKAQMLEKSSWLETRDQFKNQDGSLYEHTLTTADKSGSSTYNANGTITDNFGGQTSNGTQWELINGDTQLKETFKNGDGDTVVVIYAISVDDNTLTLNVTDQFSYPDNNGAIKTWYGEILTYSH